MLKPPFKSVGKCIYCPPDVVTFSCLGDEHIIPLGIGGKLLLPNASCQTCEQMTSGIETYCMERMLAAARPIIGVRGRKSGKVAKNLPIQSFPPLGKRRIPVAEHPCYIAFPRFGYPGIFVDSDPTKGTPIELIMADIQPNTIAKIVANRGFYMDVGNLDNYARMLAKIAHSFAVSQLGLEGFSHLLPDIIRGSGDVSYSYLLGERLIEESPTKDLHQISIFKEVLEKCGRSVWVVRLRLLASFEHSPTHDIVAGFA
jgi:hypothetical protein